MAYHNLIDDQRRALYNKTADLLLKGIGITDACKIMEHDRSKFYNWVIYNRVDAFSFYIKNREQKIKDNKDSKEKFIEQMRAKLK
jgi:hypothetical protein